MKLKSASILLGSVLLGYCGKGIVETPNEDKIISSCPEEERKRMFSQQDGFPLWLQRTKEDTAYVRDTKRAYEHIAMRGKYSEFEMNYVDQKGAENILFLYGWTASICGKN